MKSKSIYDTAGSLLDSGYTCSQSVFKAIKDNYDLFEELDEHLFAGFGGGFASTGKVCGTVVASTALLSKALINTENPQDRSYIYSVLREFYAEIEEKYGSVNCRNIVDIDFLDPNDAKRYSSEKHNQVCKPLVSYIAQRVDEILEKHELKK